MWNRTEVEIEIEIDWMRHGLTQSNEEHRYLGQTDEGLSEHGKEQILEKGERNVAGMLVSSPMKRCVETANLLYGRTPDLMISEWVEIDFGAFEGMNAAELHGNAAYQKWIDSGGSNPFPEGESREAYTERCMKGLERLLLILLREQKKAEKIQNITAVVHGGTIMAVLSSLTRRDYFDFQTQNGTGYHTTLGVIMETDGDSTRQREREESNQPLSDCVFRILLTQMKEIS